MVLNEVLDKQAQNICFLCMYYLYVCVSSDLCVHVEIRGQYLGVYSLLWDLGIQVRLSGLYNKHTNTFAP